MTGFGSIWTVGFLVVHHSFFFVDFVDFGVQILFFFVSFVNFVVQIFFLRVLRKLRGSSSLTGC